MLSSMLCLAAEGPRPTTEQIKHLRSYMILYIKKMVLKGQGALDDEIQALINFLTTVHEVRDRFTLNAQSCCELLNTVF